MSASLTICRTFNEVVSLIGRFLFKHCQRTVPFGRGVLRLSADPFENRDNFAARSPLHTQVLPMASSPSGFCFCTAAKYRPFHHCSVSPLNRACNSHSCRMSAPTSFNPCRVASSTPG